MTGYITFNAIALAFILFVAFHPAPRLLIAAITGAH